MVKRLFKNMFFISTILSNSRIKKYKSLLIVEVRSILWILTMFKNNILKSEKQVLKSKKFMILP